VDTTVERLNRSRIAEPEDSSERARLMPGKELGVEAPVALEVQNDVP
jgi:hypothetical protein